MLRLLFFGLAAALLTITALYSLSPGDTRKLLREFVGLNARQTVISSSRAPVVMRDKRQGADKEASGSHSAAAEPWPVRYIIINPSASELRSRDVRN
ncbi:MAG: hypothetical protein ACR2OV_07055 [Hyphomicrobiaceae bacterium]